MSKQTFQGTVTNIWRGTIDSHQTPFALFFDMRYRPEKHRKCCKLRLRFSQGWGLDSGPRLLHVGKDVVTVMIRGVCVHFLVSNGTPRFPGAIILGLHFIFFFCEFYKLYGYSSLIITDLEHFFFLSKYLIFKLLIWYQHLCVYEKLYVDTLQWKHMFLPAIKLHIFLCFHWNSISNKKQNNQEIKDYFFFAGMGNSVVNQLYFYWSKYSWFTILCYLQVYNVVIQYFYGLYSI